MDVVAFSSPSEAARHFATLLGSLEEAVKGLPEGEQHRAIAIVNEAAKEFRRLVSSKEEHERATMLVRIRDHLTELERLLAGQRQLFASELRERVAARYLLALHEPVTQIFKELFSILDAIADLIEADTMRRLGIKPTPSVPGKPRVKAPKTYKQAQDEILQHLQKAGWTVVGHLKIPHATSKDGFFRFWFKPQAIYYSERGPRSTSWDFGAARSMWAKDYRFEDPEKFTKGLEAYAARAMRRDERAAV